MTSWSHRDVCTRAAKVGGTSCPSRASRSPNGDSLSSTLFDPGHRLLRVQDLDRPHAAPGHGATFHDAIAGGRRVGRSRHLW